MSKINIQVNGAYQRGSRIISRGGVVNLYHYEMRAPKMHALMVYTYLIKVRDHDIPGAHIWFVPQQIIIVFCL